MNIYYTCNMDGKQFQLMTCNSEISRTVYIHVYVFTFIFKIFKQTPDGGP
jgi:hypothetical protein